jgi:hypothetical protein
MPFNINIPVFHHASIPYARLIFIFHKTSLFSTDYKIFETHCYQLGDLTWLLIQTGHRQDSLYPSNTS